MDKNIKIEVDLVNGIQVVESFDSETRVMEGMDAKDYLSDFNHEGVLGFEISEIDVFEIESKGYDIKIL
jgi:hypothetical protein